jgi:hypothetical protein
MGELFEEYFNWFVDEYLPQLRLDSLDWLDKKTTKIWAPFSRVLYWIFGPSLSFAYNLRLEAWKSILQFLSFHNDILLFLFFAFFIPLTWLVISLRVGKPRRKGISLISQFSVGGLYMTNIFIFFMGIYWFFKFKDLVYPLAWGPFLFPWVWIKINNWVIRGTLRDYAFAHQTYLICIDDHEDGEGEGGLWDLGFLTPAYLCGWIYYWTVFMSTKKWYWILAIAAVTESIVDGFVANWFLNDNPPPIKEMPPRWVPTYVWNRFIVEDDISFTEDDFSHDTDDDRQWEDADILMHRD